MEEEGGGDNKLFSRLLTREDFNNNNNSNGYSCRIYYTAFSGSVPFLWEVEPGKPKAPAIAREGTLRPLNPPPCLRSCGQSSEASSINNGRMFLQKMKSIMHLGAKLKKRSQGFHKGARNPQNCAGDYQISESGSSSDVSKSSSESGDSEFDERLVSIAVSQGRNWGDSLVRPAMVWSYGGRHRRW